MTGESILIVEDEGVIALRLKELLEKNGYRVFRHHGIWGGCRDDGERRPDLICMDIGLMGKIDGIEAAAEDPTNTQYPGHLPDLLF